MPKRRTYGRIKQSNLKWYLLGALIVIGMVWFMTLLSYRDQTLANTMNFYAEDCVQEQVWMDRMIKEANKPVELTKATVTAYSEYDSCHYPNCVMANGVRAHIGAVACPRSLELGSKVLIDGVEYECSDRTALRLDGRFDIFMGYGQESYNKAINFGKRELTITVL